MKFDEVLKKHVGECGRYQAFLCFIIAFFTGLICAATMSDIVFIAAIPDYLCHDVTSGQENGHVASESPYSLNQVEPHHVNGNNNSLSKDYLYGENVEWKGEKCHMVRLNVTSMSGNPGQSEAPSSGEVNDDAIIEKRTCSKWGYDQSVFTSTVVTQWDLVCSRAYLVSLAPSLSLAGCLVSIFFTGFLADRFGRRPILIATSLTMLVARIADAFAPSTAVFLCARFFLGFSQVTYGIGYVYVVEILAPKGRVWIALSMQCMWALGLVIVAGIAFGIRSWRTLDLVFIVPHVIILLVHFLIPESARWLVSRGRHKEARVILQTIAHRNGRRNFPADIAIAEDVSSEEHKATILDLLKYPVMTKRTFLAAFVWMNIAFAYFMLLYNVGHLVGDIYVNTIISSLVEIPAYVACNVMMTSPLGRRTSLSGALVLSALIMFCSIAAIYTAPLVGTVLAMAGKFTISFAFMAVYMHTAEVFPTSLRSASMGICSTMARVGGIVSPFAILLNTWSPLITPILFGCSTLVAGLLLLLLPETRGRPLPQTIEEAAAMTRNGSSKELQVKT